MVRKAVVALVLSFFISGCAGVKFGPRSKQQDKGSAPVIVDHYAAPVVAVGDNWKIFLHARDQDGDIKYVAAELYQAGVGFYRTNFTFVKEADQAEVSGYLLLPFPYDYSFFDDRFEMWLLVRDQKDNPSTSLRLPLRIGHWSEEEIPEKWQEAANNQLNIIILNLESSQFYNRGAESTRRGD